MNRNTELLSPSLDRLTARWSKKTGIDLRRYRNHELVQRTEAMFSLVRIVPLMVQSIAVMWAAAALVWFVLFFGHLHPASLTLLAAYMLLVTWFFGVLLGIMRLIRRILGHIAGIVDLTLGSVQAMSQDVARMSAPEADARASLGEMFEGALYVIVVPVIKAVIAAKVGVLRVPVTWLLERSLLRVGRAASRLVARSAPESAKHRPGAAGEAKTDADNVAHAADGADERPGEGKAAAVNGVLVRVESGASRTDEFLDSARASVERAARRIIAFALFPLRAAFAVGLVVASVPVVLTYLLLV